MHGIVVTFLGGFDGCIDLLHLAQHGGDGEIENTYPVKTKVITKALYAAHDSAAKPLHQDMDYRYIDLQLGVFHANEHFWQVHAHDFI